MLLCFAAVCETAHTAVIQSHIGVSTADQQDTGAVVNVSGIPHHLHLVPVLQGCNGRTAGDGGPVIRRFR